ncbi:TrmH family RNA methyltransferase [Marinibaculum pumilum]|uniref:TrmH family RNA methyltransferase n=1 Tax=Marinibaculum pumilum TaxID=1766165 RepID=A0ABV7L7Y6_9PROT
MSSSRRSGPRTTPSQAPRRNRGAGHRDAGAPHRGDADAPHRGNAGAPRRGGRKGPAAKPAGGTYWLYGRHAVQAAIDNPQRRIQRLLAAPKAAAGLRLAQGRQVEPAEMQDLARLLPPGAVHQGIAALVEPLQQPALRDWLAGGGGGGGAGARAVIVLDQVTDPQNVGTILRSATAFGAAAIVTTAAHAPEEGGPLAKAASGALDMLPYLREPNLARALEQLAEAGFWRIALDADGDETLAAARPQDRPVALILGAEGSGLRRLTRAHSDCIARLPIAPAIGSLNVAQAATAALYELARTGLPGGGGQ